MFSYHQSGGSLWAQACPYAFPTWKHLMENRACKLEGLLSSWYSYPKKFRLWEGRSWISQLKRWTTSMCLMLRRSTFWNSAVLRIRLSLSFWKWFWDNPNESSIRDQQFLTTEMSEEIKRIVGAQFVLKHHWSFPCVALISCISPSNIAAVFPPCIPHSLVGICTSTG